MKETFDVKLDIYRLLGEFLLLTDFTTNCLLCSGGVDSEKKRIKALLNIYTHLTPLYVSLLNKADTFNTQTACSACGWMEKKRHDFWCRRLYNNIISHFMLLVWWCRVVRHHSLHVNTTKNQMSIGRSVTVMLWSKTDPPCSLNTTPYGMDLKSPHISPRATNFTMTPCKISLMAWFCTKCSIRKKFACVGLTLSPHVHHEKRCFECNKWKIFSASRLC